MAYSSLPLVVQAIKFATAIWGMTKENETITPKQDQQVAAASLEMLAATQTGHSLLEKVSALPEEDATKLWEEMLAHQTLEKK